MGPYRGGRRARAIALARRREPPSLLPWLALAVLLLAAVAAHAQTTRTGPTDGRTAPPPIVQPAPPAAPGGGEALSHGNGVITPPSRVDPAMPVARPNPNEFPTPNVQPPAPLGGGEQKVVPK
jgi:hypothetical protein